MKKTIRDLHEALIDLTGILNRPQQDAALIRAAGVELDRALFPLLSRIERRGPLGVMELADLAGRDYTTVSRQVSKLESLDLIARQVDPADRRNRMASVTREGRKVVAALDAAREAIVADLFAAWPRQDTEDFVRLLRRFVDAALAATSAE